MEDWDKLKDCQPHPILKQFNEIECQVYTELPDRRQMKFYISTKVGRIDINTIDLTVDTIFFKELTGLKPELIFSGEFKYHYRLTVSNDFVIPNKLDEEYAGYFAVPLIQSLRSFLNQAKADTPAESNMAIFTDNILHEFNPIETMIGHEPIFNQ